MAGAERARGAVVDGAVVDRYFRCTVTSTFIATPALGARPPRIKVQVKRQQQAVGAEGLRAFMALLREDDVGLFVCTGGFTRDAETEARVPPPG